MTRRVRLRGLFWWLGLGILICREHGWHCDGQDEPWSTGL